LYYQKKFKKDVIDSFIDSYVAGETPIPCIQCNQTVKFRDLFLYSKKLNADALITGHYVSRIQKNNKAEMYRAQDLSKDQSYFLFNTTQEQLDFLRFPLGKMTKKETRAIASELKLNVADKPDSQDICFVPNGNYASIIEKYRPESFEKGNIVNLENKVLGQHDGIINYTVGQRKGIRIAEKEPLYVIKINANKNEIVVGPKSELLVKEIYLRDVNVLSDIESHNNNLQVKIRSTGRMIKAHAKIKDGSAKVYLEDKESGVSSGQACVFYSKDNFGDKVLGGGWITKVY
jgi:tRNA-specific 2-thiouridylase